MNVRDRDALDHAIVKTRSLFMAIHGADSIMEQDEANSLQFLAADVLRDLERVQISIGRAPDAPDALAA